MQEVVSNKKMDELMLDTSTRQPRIDVAMLEKLLTPEVVVENGCVLLHERGAQYTQPKTKDTIDDLTGYEAFCNHIHLSDYFNLDDVDEPWLARFGRLVLEVWALVVAQVDPGHTHCFILSIIKPKDAVLRMHTVRSGEPLWLANDLEEYKNEAVGYFII